MINHNINIKIRKIISVFLILTFLLQSNFLSANFEDFSFSKNKTLNNNILNNDLVIGLDTGRVCDYFESFGNEKNLGKVIIIKDLHCNEEAQNNIFEILNNIKTRYNDESFYFRDVLVEGAWGNLTYSQDMVMLKALPQGKIKSDFFDKILNAGIFTGSEKFVISNIDKNLIGIEDEKIYKQNFEAFSSALRVRKDINYFLITLINRYILDKQNRKNYSKNLKDLDKLVIKYKNNEISIIEYIDSLKKFVNFLDFDVEIPNLMKSYKIAKLEQNFGNFKNIMVQALTVEKIIFPRLSKEEFKEISRLRSQNNKKDSSNYYLFLQNLILKNDIQNLVEDNFKELYMYFEYLNMLNSIDTTLLILEEKNFLFKLGNLLATSEDEKQFLKLGRILDLFYRFSNNAALTEEVIEINKNKNEYFEIFKNYVNKSIKDRISLLIMKDLFLSFEKQINNMQTFYSLADNRNLIFADNIEKILKDNYSKFAEKKKIILPVVVGGYHSKALGNILKEKNISYIMISPNITKEIYSNLYEKNSLNQSRVNNLQNKIDIEKSTLALQVHFQTHILAENELTNKAIKMSPEEILSMQERVFQSLIQDKRIDWTQDINTLESTFRNNFRMTDTEISIAKEIAKKIQEKLEIIVKEEEEKERKKEEERLLNQLLEERLNTIFTDRRNFEVQKKLEAKKKEIMAGKDAEIETDIIAKLDTAYEEARQIFADMPILLSKEQQNTGIFGIKILNILTGRIKDGSYNFEDEMNRLNLDDSQRNIVFYLVAMIDEFKKQNSSENAKARHGYALLIDPKKDPNTLEGFVEIYKKLMNDELADRQKNIRETARKSTNKVHKETGFDVDKIKDQDKIFEVFSDLAPKNKTEQQIKEDIIIEINSFLELMKAKLDPNNSDVPNFYSNDDRVNTIKKYYKGDIKKAKFILQLMDNLKIDKDNKDLLEAYKEAIKKYFNEEIKIEKYIETNIVSEKKKIKDDQIKKLKNNVQKSSIMDERKKFLRGNATLDVDNEHKKTRKSIEAEVKETLKEIAREELESEIKEFQKNSDKARKKNSYISLSFKEDIRNYISALDSIEPKEIDKKQKLDEIKSSIKLSDITTENLKSQDLIKSENEKQVRNRAEQMLEIMGSDKKAEIIAKMKEFEPSIADDADIQTLPIEQIQKYFFPALCFIAFNEATLSPEQQVVFLREISTNLKKIGRYANFDGVNVESGTDFNSKIEIYIDTLLKQDVVKKYIARQKEIKSIKDNFQNIIKGFSDERKKEIQTKVIDKLEKFLLSPDLSDEDFNKIKDFLNLDSLLQIYEKNRDVLSSILFIENMDNSQIFNFFNNLILIKTSDTDLFKKLLNEAYNYIEEENIQKPVYNLDKKIEKLTEEIKNLEEERRSIYEEAIVPEKVILELENSIKAKELKGENVVSDRNTLEILRKRALLKAKDLVLKDKEIKTKKDQLSTLNNSKKQRDLLQDKNLDMKTIGELIQENNIEDAKKFIIEKETLSIKANEFRDKKILKKAFDKMKEFLAKKKLENQKNKATDAVLKAEKNVNRQKFEEADILVKALPESEEKNELQRRLDILRLPITRIELAIANRLIQKTLQEKKEIDIAYKRLIEEKKVLEQEKAKHDSKMSDLQRQSAEIDSQIKGLEIDKDLEEIKKLKEIKIFIDNNLLKLNSDKKALEEKLNLLEEKQRILESKKLELSEQKNKTLSFSQKKQEILENLDKLEKQSILEKEKAKTLADRKEDISDKLLLAKQNLDLLNKKDFSTEENEISELSARIDQLTLNKKQLSEKQQKDIQQKNSLEEEISKVRSQLDQLGKDRKISSDLQSQLLSAKSNMDRLQKEQEISLQKLNRLEDDLKKLQSTIAQKGSILRNLNEEIERLRSDLNSKRLSLNSEKNRLIDEDKAILEEERVLNSEKQKLITLNKSILQKKKQKEDLERNLDLKKQTLIDMEQEKNEQMAKLQRVLLEHFSKKNKMEDDTKRLSQDRALKYDEFMRKKERQKTYSSQLADLQKKFDLAKQKLEDEYRNLETEKQKQQDFENEIRRDIEERDSLLRIQDEIRAELELKTREHDELSATLAPFEKLRKMIKTIKELKNKINSELLDKEQRYIEKIAEQRKIYESLKQTKQVTKIREAYGLVIEYEDFLANFYRNEGSILKRYANLEKELNSELENLKSKGAFERLKSRFLQGFDVVASGLGVGTIFGATVGLATGAIVGLSMGIFSMFKGQEEPNGIERDLLLLIDRIQQNEDDILELKRKLANGEEEIQKLNKNIEAKKGNMNKEKLEGLQRNHNMAMRSFEDQQNLAGNKQRELEEITRELENLSLEIGEIDKVKDQKIFLEQQILALENRMKGIEAEFESKKKILNDEIEGNKNTLVNLESDIQRGEREYLEKEEDLKRRETELLERKKKLKIDKENMEKLKKEIDDLARKLSILEENYKKQNIEFGQMKKEEEGLLDLIAKQRQELENKRKILAEDKSVETISAEIGQKKGVSDIDKELETLRLRLIDLEANLKSLTALTGQQNEELVDLNSNISKLELLRNERIKNLKALKREKETQKEKYNNEILKLEEEERVLDQEIDSNRKKLQDLELKISEGKNAFDESERLLIESLQKEKELLEDIASLQNETKDIEEINNQRLKVEQDINLYMFQLKGVEEDITKLEKTLEEKRQREKELLEAKDNVKRQMEEEAAKVSLPIEEKQKDIDKKIEESRKKEENLRKLAESKNLLEEKIAKLTIKDIDSNAERKLELDMSMIRMGLLEKEIYQEELERGFLVNSSLLGAVKIKQDKVAKQEVAKQKDTEEKPSLGVISQDEIDKLSQYIIVTKKLETTLVTVIESGSSVEKNILDLKYRPMIESGNIHSMGEETNILTKAIREIGEEFVKKIKAGNLDFIDENYKKLINKLIIDSKREKSVFSGQANVQKVYDAEQQVLMQIKSMIDKILPDKDAQGHKLGDFIETQDGPDELMSLYNTIQDRISVLEKISSLQEVQKKEMINSFIENIYLQINKLEVLNLENLTGFLNQINAKIIDEKPSSVVKNVSVGYKPKQNPGGGNCMYYSFLHAIGMRGTQEQVQQLRNELATYIERNADNVDFINRYALGIVGSIRANLNQIPSVGFNLLNEVAKLPLTTSMQELIMPVNASLMREYANFVRKNGVWGTDVDLKLLGEIKRVNLKLIQDGDFVADIDVENPVKSLTIKNIGNYHYVAMMPNVEQGAALSGKVDQTLLEKKAVSKTGLDQIFENAKKAVKELSQTSFPTLGSIIEKISFKEYGVVEGKESNLVSAVKDNELVVRATLQAEALISVLIERGLDSESLYTQVFMHEILEMALQIGGLQNQVDAHISALSLTGTLQKLVSDIFISNNYVEISKILKKEQGIEITPEELEIGVNKYILGNANVINLPAAMTKQIDEIKNELFKQSLKNNPPSSSGNGGSGRGLFNVLFTQILKPASFLMSFGTHSLQMFQSLKDFQFLSKSSFFGIQKDIIENLKNQLPLVDGWGDKIKLKIVNSEISTGLVFVDGVWYLTKKDLEIIKAMQYITNGEYLKYLIQHEVGENRITNSIKNSLDRFDFLLNKQKISDLTTDEIAELTSLENLPELSRILKTRKDYARFLELKDKTNLSQSEKDELENLKKKFINDKGEFITLEEAVNIDILDLAHNAIIKEMGIDLQNKYEHLYNYVKNILDMKDNKRFLDFSIAEDFMNYLKTTDFSSLFIESENMYSQVEVQTQNNLDIIARTEEFLKYSLEDSVLDIQEDNREIIIDVSNTDNREILDIVMQKILGNGLNTGVAFAGKTIAIRGDIAGLMSDNLDSNERSLKSLQNLFKIVVGNGGKISYIPSYTVMKKVVNRELSGKVLEDLVKKNIISFASYFPSTNAIVMSPGTIVDTKIVEFAKAFYGEKYSESNSARLITNLLNLELRLRLGFYDGISDMLISNLKRLSGNDFSHGILNIIATQKYTLEEIESIVKNLNIRQFIVANQTISPDLWKIFVNVKEDLTSKNIELVKGDITKAVVVNVSETLNDLEVHDTKDINNLTEESVSTKILAPIRITLEDLNTASKIFFKTEHATKKIIADISKILEIIIPFVSKIRQNLIKRNEDIYNSEVQNMLKNISASA